MSKIIEEGRDIITAILIVSLIIFIISIITYIYEKLTQRELSDQLGWKNFAKPFIGVAIFSIMSLVIVLTILALYGAF